MKILPAALMRPRKQAPKRSEPEIGIVTAVALSLLAVVGVFIVGEAYLSRVTLTADERSALLNTLLLGDMAIFGVSLLITALLWYFSSVHYGGRGRQGPLGSRALPLFGTLLVLPVVFVASDLAFKPLFFAKMDVEIALALSVIGVLALVPYATDVLEHIKPRGMLAGLIEEIRRQFDGSGQDGPLEPVALQRPVFRSSAGMGLASLLDRLCHAGDLEPVLAAQEAMKGIAIREAPQKSPRSIALASAMVTLIAETAVIAVKHGRHEVVYRALDDLGDVTERSPQPGIAALAFRSLGSVFNLCAPALDERALSRLETKMMESYAALYDRTRRPEALELAVAMAEKAVGSKMFVAEEYDGILYAAGAVYRRMAEANDSEEYANRSLAALQEALTARTAEASPLDHACIKGEIGRAYLALARIKNPLKCYRSAASAFEDAGRILDAGIAPWDLAVYRGKAASAYTFLADEYCRGKRYDDAIQAARGALALYPEARKFFERRSRADYAEVSSDLGFANTIVSEVYLRSRMFDVSLKHAALALDAYSAAAKAIDAGAAPERYAFLRTNIGLTHVTMAEIHFREKRYENAITACDDAIAAYNEAIRIYDEEGKPKPATAARRHLKKANDLFSTMMRIGVTERKPIPLAVER